MNELTINEPKNLEAMISQEEDKRKLLTKYVKKNLTKGTDFYELTFGGRTSKPSLSKSGSEKVMSLFHWIAEFTKDEDTWEMLGRPAGVLCYKCVLLSARGVKVGEGKGARDTKKDNGDFNKSIKMAQKSAQIDAVLRTGGLSDVFTQDIEDMAQDRPETLPTVNYGAKRPYQKKDHRQDDIKALLKELGHDPRTLKDAQNLILKLTDETFEEKNYDEIINKLSLLMSERAPNV